MTNKSRTNLVRKSARGGRRRRHRRLHSPVRLARLLRAAARKRRLPEDKLGAPRAKGCGGGGGGGGGKKRAGREDESTVVVLPVVQRVSHNDSEYRAARTVKVPHGVSCFVMAGARDDYSCDPRIIPHYRCQLLLGRRACDQ